MVTTFARSYPELALPPPGITSTPAASPVTILPNDIGLPALMGQVDLYPVESHELGAEVTSYPVESGASRSDNVVIRPKRLKMSGHVASLLAIDGPATPDKAVDVWQAIITLMEQRERMTVSTTLGDYEDMVITRVKAPVDVSTGKSLQFEMSLQEVLVERVIQRPLVNPAGPAGDRTAAVDAGSRPPAPLAAALPVATVAAVTAIAPGVGSGVAALAAAGASAGLSMSWPAVSDAANNFLSNVFARGGGGGGGEE